MKRLSGLEPGIGAPLAAPTADLTQTSLLSAHPRSYFLFLNVYIYIKKKTAII